MAIDRRFAETASHVQATHRQADIDRLDGKDTTPFLLLHSFIPSHNGVNVFSKEERPFHQSRGHLNPFTWYIKHKPL